MLDLTAIVAATLTVACLVAAYALILSEFRGY
jgi:hypothetical protein